MFMEKVVPEYKKCQKKDTTRYSVIYIVNNEISDLILFKK